MKPSGFPGLLLALCLALAVAGLALVGARPAPSALAASASASHAPTVAPPTAVPSNTPAPTAAPKETAPPTSASPSVTSTPEPLPAAQTPPMPTEVADDTVAGTVIGYSVEGRRIEAFRIGQGPIKVVLVGDIHGEPEANTFDLVQQLLAHFRSSPGAVPERVSLWFIPTLNPDGLATGHRWNANGVDLNRNADTSLDGCAGNDWSPDTYGLEGEHAGAGGRYPFSEPETRAARDFLEDAWVAVFYHSAAEAIITDTCRRHAPTARLAAALSEGSGYPIPDDGWSGYPVTGDLADYLAGEGVAAVIVELKDHADPEFARNLSGVEALLRSVDEVVEAEARAANAEMVWLDSGNTGAWRYPENSFPHPLALELIGDTAYLLDGGRVLALDLTRPSMPQVLLAPGDTVGRWRVLEPLDMAVADMSLLVMDRAGDVYLYDPEAGLWTLERPGRQASGSGDQYYVAISAHAGTRYLLETTHEQLWRFRPGGQLRVGAKLPQGRDVDVSAARSGVYILTRALSNPRGSLLFASGSDGVKPLQTRADLMHPRQVSAAGQALYVLDRAGRRVLALEPADGALRSLYQFTDRRSVSAIWANPTARAEASPGAGGSALVLAGPDVLYFYGEPEREASVEGEPQPGISQAYDPDFLEEMRGLAMPIEGARVTRRDYQMPGAPRHYRLGVHEGIDFYTSTAGVPIDGRTPVRAVEAGLVIRATLDYEPLTAAQAQAWAAQCRSLGYTPPDVLDGYRGMQVWIEHAGGLVSRYAHLSEIAPGIVEGAWVERGQVLGKVGNSGTPDSLSGPTVGLHLHLELWVGEHYIGQFLRPIEVREWIERILQ